MPKGIDGIGISWKVFGTTPEDNYTDGLVHSQFRRCGVGSRKINIPIKTLFRDPLRFAEFGAHAPKPSREHRKRAIADFHFVDGEGRRIDRFNGDIWPVRHLPLPQITHTRAQLNHYILRTRENYALKRGTPSASAGVDRYTDAFFERRNFTKMRDRTALRFTDRFKLLHDAAMAIPEVARLHHLCCAQYLERLCAVDGRDHTADARWQKHMSQR